MRCEEARSILWPPERPRLVGSEVAEARAHIEGCEACQAYFSQDRELLEVWARAKEVRAPADVRERVFDALAQARWSSKLGEESHVGTPSRLDRLPTSRWKQAGLLAGAAAGLVLAMGWANFGTSPAQPPGAVFVEDYLRRAVGEDHIETNDPAEVIRFLERELGIRVEPIRLAGLELARAEICLLEGQRGAMIVYKENGQEVLHYIVPRDDVPRRPPVLSPRAGGTTDMPVVTWATEDVEQALVGGVEAERLLLLAALGAER